MDLSEKIRQLRKQRGLSQVKLSELIGLSQAAYAKIETGETKSITIEIGKGISKALDISFNELFDIESPKLNEDLNVSLNSEIESLKKQIEEFKSRIKEKDSLIRNAKDKLIIEIVLTHYDMILDYENRLEGIANMAERQELVKELDFVYVHEKERFNKLVATGFIELSDLEENQIYSWFHSMPISDPYSRFIEPYLGKL